MKPKALHVLFMLLVMCATASFAAAPAPKESEAAEESDAPEADARNAFLPGVAASFINQFGDGRLYPGASFHYAFIQGVTRSKSRGDFGGYYEWYAEIGFFKELASSMTDDIFFTCASGVNLSFEKFIDGTRDFLVPYFGAKAGGVFFNKGASATFGID